MGCVWDTHRINLSGGDVLLDLGLLLRDFPLSHGVLGQQRLVVPGVSLDLLQADAILLVNDENFVEQVPALLRQMRLHSSGFWFGLVLVSVFSG